MAAIRQAEAALVKLGNVVLGSLKVGAHAKVEEGRDAIVVQEASLRHDGTRHMAVREARVARSDDGTHESKR